MLSRIFDSERAVTPPTQAGREEAGEQQGPAGELQAPLGPHDLLEVVAVALAEVGDGALAEVVELGAEGVDLLGGEVAGGWGTGMGGSLGRGDGRRATASEVDDDLAAGDGHAEADGLGVGGGQLRR